MIIKYLIFVTVGINAILCQHVSQISPKSVVSSFSVEEIVQSSMPQSIPVYEENDVVEDEDEETEAIKRVERSALLTMPGETTKNLGDFNELDRSGRYFNSINPTQSESGDKVGITESYFESDPFFGQRGRRAKSESSGPLDKMSIVNQTLTNANKYNHTVRQNSSPDIQDIITGIVKLLNGNVNVHADTQGVKRPHSNRINNRGPPRISETQMPVDYDPPVQSHPEGPIRPFLSGVPLPQQLVPSMQSNFRPSFISQNRPPWQSQRPKPPHSPIRRPIPSYKPILPVSDFASNNGPENSSSNEAENVNDSNEESEESIEESVKQKHNNKIDDSKDSENNSESTEEVKPTEVYTTIIQSVSEVNTVGFIESHSLETETSTSSIETLDSSIAETTSSVPTNTETPILDKIPQTHHQQELITTPSSVEQSSTSETSNQNIQPTTTSQIQNPTAYHPRPGMVLDDPEFKPGSHQKSSPNRPFPPQRPPGYGEIFDITLSAIQGPGGGGGSQQTVKIKPYSPYEEGDLIVVSSTEGQEYVSIDGKRTYINLFGESVPAPVTSSTYISSTKPIKPTQTLQPGVTGSGYVVAETEPSVNKYNQRPVIHRRPPAHPPQDPPVRIDTCIVGDDSTCDQNQHESCKTENGVSSCHCRPLYSRRKHREPCRKVVSLIVSLRIDRIYDQHVSWDKKFSEPNSEPYYRLKYEALNAINSAMSMTPFSDEFVEAKINNFHQGYSKESKDIFVNITIMIDENNETIRPSLKTDIQHHLLGVIHRRNNNIGNSALYVESPPGSVSAIQDLNECSSYELNDCHSQAVCTNTWGGFRCDCLSGFKDPWLDNPHKSGRECLPCSESHCNNRGTCSYDDNTGNQVCKCIGNYYGSACEIDGDVIGVAIGASVCALIIIILTLICLIMWSRKWQREHKNTMIGSPVFGYMNTQIKTPIVGTTPYQVTLEDRMRWAQIADVIQANPNHYAVEPVPVARPKSNIFAGFPHVQQMQAGTLPMTNNMNISTNYNRGTLPPVPLPRLGLNRTNGMRTLENSSSSDDDDRAELTNRNFHVPRPKSTASLSLTNQSGIYYDLDFDRPGGENLYGMTNNYNTYTSKKDFSENKNDKYKTVSSNKIPMTTYSTRAPSTTYYN